MYKKKSLLLICLCSELLLGSGQGIAGDCTDASGNTVTISIDCRGLDFSGDVIDFIINSGVTIDQAGKGAVDINNNTVTNFTNNGTIEASKHFGLRHNGSGEISTLTNTGTITADERYGLNVTSSDITNLINSGTISAGTHTGLRNRGGTIKTIDNTGTISATHHDALNNSNYGTIETINNSGTISAGTDRGLKNVSGTIETINNTGTISAAEDYGLRNEATIGILDNSGTISANDNSGVWNGGTITTLMNSGNIQAITAEFGLKNVNGTIGTLTNSSMISAGDRYGIYNNGTAIITTLTNSGTISADRSGIWNDATITTLTNSGNIKALTGDFGLKNVRGTIGTLTNSGTISAGDDWGIYNDSSATITTLTNTGTISASGNNIGIFNDTDSTITTLNNSQGASSSALTYDGKLPTTYNIIVNSTSDFGKITFSSVSGTTNFGVDSSSTLVADTTYSSVISGLSSSEIASGTSGSHVAGSLRFDWTLINSSGSIWDLVVAANQDIAPDTNTSVNTTLKPNVVLGMNNMTSVTEVNFANMNTYDCDLFDENNICLSLGSRYTSINTPKTEANSGVMVAGYKFSDTLRIAGFYHSNLSHKTPANFQLSDKTPLTGGLVVWNQNSNHVGFQLKLANAQQQKHATFTREVVGTSEEGKGQTVIEAKSYVAELQYGYQYSDNTVLRPYLAARSAVITQEAYTETGNSSPLSFNEIEDKSMTVLLGLKSKTELNQKLSLKGSVGIEYDIEHSVDKLEPTGMSGLTTVSLTDDFNRTRPVVSLGFEYALRPNQRIAGTLQYQELPYLSKTETNAYLHYTIGI